MVDRMTSAKTSYDRRADTFYFTVAVDKPQRYTEDDDGLIWRFSPDGALVGVTVQAYRRLWTGRQSALATKIAKSFRLEPSDVARRLPPIASVRSGDAPSAYA